jgi:hypothetical protein
MTRRISLLACLCCCWIGLMGCSEKKKMQMDASAMQPPPRPAELDLMNPWVGRWASTGEAKMPDGQPMNSTGTSEIAWDLDNRFLVEKSTESMGNMGTVKSVIVFSYNPREKEYEVDYYDSMGSHGEADMHYDASTGAWHMVGEPEYNPMWGKKTVFDMTMTMPDTNTLQFKWAEYEAFLGGKGKKLVEGTGTARRQS